MNKYIVTFQQKIDIECDDEVTEKEIIKALKEDVPFLSFGIAGDNFISAETRPPIKIIEIKYNGKAKDWSDE